MASKTSTPKEKIQLSEKHIEAFKKRSHLSEEVIRSTFEDFHQMTSSGQLTLEEFSKLWNDISPQAPVNDPEPDHMTKRVFAFFDRDHSGKVDFNEFLMASILMTPGKPSQKLALLFVTCDFNHDGFLSQEEIERMYLINKAGEEQFDQKQFEAFKSHLNKIFPQYDINKDGKMSQKEFRNLCDHDEVFQKIVA